MSTENETIVIDFPEPRIISLMLSGKSYSIPSYFSFHDLLIYQEVLKRDNSAKKALVEVIYHKLETLEQSIPTKNELYLENDSSFEPYILAIVSNGNELGKYYSETDCSLLATERFAIAFNQYVPEFTKKISEQIQPALKQFMQSINVPKLNASFSRIARQMTELFAPIQKIASQISTYLFDVFSKIQIPTLTQEEKEALKASYEKWGQFGWSAIPNSTITLYSHAPLDYREADKIALKYFNTDGLKDLFAKLQETPLRKNDLNSAIYCFEHKQYKACATLLFGIIDSKLIRLQAKTETNNRRQVGQKAIRKLETKIREKADLEKYLYHFLYLSNLTSCLSTFFENGNDFLHEPKTINRNYILHGMNKRSVRRKDCIQLFLALYNLTNLLDDLKSF
ncbi:hypothetical protein M2150_002467 [Lachnospiraceae bacterium PM6-15]|uniref:Uncharacterized protein n=1 Tax=Ohessyouella blattaphilus TaxID=2949333 RepID=A0ABT1EPA2_9FIRM|nr:hypothetical protein [Ohessyouella blattaphilus]MCP1111597.1 hypothetical protein [Ohessyouella blattaphilus]MCR8564991.1 hypothetical protein [Ohessyouella blattaphilus]